MKTRGVRCPLISEIFTLANADLLDFACKQYNYFHMPDDSLILVLQNNIAFVQDLRSDKGTILTDLSRRVYHAAIHSHQHSVFLHKYYIFSAR